jgi:hypothetical protein
MIQHEEEHQPQGDVRIPASVILTTLLSPRTYEGTLPNGKLIFVHEAGPTAPHPRTVGEQVTVALSLCDFNRGQIMA